MFTEKVSVTTTPPPPMRVVIVDDVDPGFIHLLGYPSLRRTITTRERIMTDTDHAMPYVPN